jgi:hypothetical protein
MLIFNCLPDGLPGRKGPVAVGLHGGRGGEETTGVGMLRMMEEGRNGGLFHDLAVLHDGYPVGHLGDYGKIVRDEEHGELVRSAQIFEEIQNLGLNGDIEGGRGLIGDQKSGPVDERHGDQDALALAAGELVRVIAGAAFGLGQADIAHRGQDSFFEEIAGDVGMVGLERFGDLSADGHGRIEGGHRFLEDHRDTAAAVAAHGLFRKRQQIFSGKINAPGNLR